VSSPALAAGRRRTILALGGHEFSRARGNEAISDMLLALAPPPARICLLPTASGDATAQIRAFRSTLGGRGYDASHISLFRLEHERVPLVEHLLSQDLIYVGGGSMVNLLAIWRAHGIDEILRVAWERGIVLAGQSAGAMCWFEAGISRSRGQARMVPGLGFVPGLLSVHYHRDGERREALLRMVAERGRSGYGLDDCAGVLIRERAVSAALSGRDGAGVFRVEPDGSGAARETRLVARELSSPRPAIDDVAEDIRELRRVRALKGTRATSRRAGER